MDLTGEDRCAEGGSDDGAGLRLDGAAQVRCQQEGWVGVGEFQELSNKRGIHDVFVAWDVVNCRDTVFWCRSRPGCVWREGDASGFELC